MDYTASNGKTYRVQFVHSAHDLKHRHQGDPGGLRQITDNLALSLRRRVTLCEVSEVTVDPQYLDHNLRPLKVATPLAQGFALCHFHDQFVKETGRLYALERALKFSGLDEQTCEEIAHFCGFCYSW